MSRFSKYNETRTRRIPKKPSGRKVAGSGDDDNKWYRCRFCGFRNNIDRNAIGSGQGITYSISTDDNTESKMNDSSVHLLGISRGLGRNEFVLIQDVGHIFIETHTVGAQSASGCSFCGSLNWR
jgi:hypothetical protein